MGLDGQQLHPSMRASRETQHGPGFKETINTVTCPSLATLKGDKRNTSVKRVMFMDVHWLGLQKNLPSYHDEMGKAQNWSTQVPMAPSKLRARELFQRAP